MNQLLSTIVFRQYILRKILQMISSYAFFSQNYSNLAAKENNYSVVAWNGNIDVSQWIVWVDEANDWYVDIRSFSDSLMIRNRVGDDDQTWLFECLLNLICEWTWCETASNRCSALKKRIEKQKLFQVQKKNKRNETKREIKRDEMFRWLSQYEVI